MSHDPLDPSSDPLLVKLGQLGVPAGGAPSATAAALLSKAAVAAPVVVGLAGAKLYGLLVATLAVGLGGGVVITELVRGDGPQTAESLAMVELATGGESTPSIEQCEELLDEMEPAVVEEGAADDGIVCADAEPASPQVVYVTRYIEVPVATGDAADVLPSALGGLDDADDGAADDDWIGEPEDDYAPPPPRLPPSPESVEPDPLMNGTASAEVVPTNRRVEEGLQPAEGHLRIGLDGGGAAFPGGSMGDLAGTVGLELLGPGPVRAAPLLAANLDAGLTGALPLGTLALDGEAGVAFRPQPDLRVSVSGVGGVRILDETYWDTYLEGLTGLRPEETRVLEASLPEGAVVLPTFGGRLGLVLGDRRRSPLAFRASLTGQVLFFREPIREETVVIPRIGGTVGIDVLLPSPPE